MPDGTQLKGTQLNTQCLKRKFAEIGKKKKKKKFN